MLALCLINSALAYRATLIAFTILLSTILSLAKTQKRLESFGITAAASAVLVVFYGNSIANSG